MSLDADSERTNISDRAAGDDQLANAEAIDTAKEVAVGDVDSITLFLDVAAAIDVVVEFSPDGGSNWYEPAKESPVSFSASGTDIQHIDFNATHLRIKAKDSTNTTKVTAQIREVV